MNVGICLLHILAAVNLNDSIAAAADVFVHDTVIGLGHSEIEAINASENIMIYFGWHFLVNLSAIQFPSSCVVKQSSP